MAGLFRYLCLDKEALKGIGSVLLGEGAAEASTAMEKRRAAKSKMKEEVNKAFADTEPHLTEILQKVAICITDGGPEQDLPKNDKEYA